MRYERAKIARMEAESFRKSKSRVLYQKKLELEQLRQARARLEEEEPARFSGINPRVKADKPQRVAEFVGKQAGSAADV